VNLNFSGIHFLELSWTWVSLRHTCLNSLELEFLWDTLAWTPFNLNSSGTHLFELSWTSIHLGHDCLNSLELEFLHNQLAKCSCVSTWISRSHWTNSNERQLQKLREDRKGSTYFQKFLSVLSITAGNELVSKGTGVYYRGHMPQQVSYQGSSILVAAWTPLQKHVLRNVTIYIYCDVFGRMPSLLGNLKLDTSVVTRQPKVKHLHGYARD
jgi:hypothetical protein